MIQKYVVRLKEKVQICSLTQMSDIKIFYQTGVEFSFLFEIIPTSTVITGGMIFEKLLEQQHMFPFAPIEVLQRCRLKILLNFS